MKFLRQTLAIAAKDLRSEIRGKEAVNASVSFALVILLLFSFAFDLEPEQTREIAAGLLWLVFTFAGTLILNRSFARELRAIVFRKMSCQLPSDRRSGMYQSSGLRYFL